MKKLFTVLFVLIGVNMYSQSVVNVNEEKGPFLISADRISLDNITNIYEYTGNVTFKDELFEIKGAKKVVYNMMTKEVTATGSGEMESGIDGVIFFKDKCTPEHTLYYKIGTKELFVNKDCD